MTHLCVSRINGDLGRLDRYISSHREKRIHADVWANAATTRIDAIISEPPHSKVVSNPIGQHAENYAGDAYDDGDRGFVVLDETDRQAGILAGWAEKDIS